MCKIKEKQVMTDSQTLRGPVTGQPVEEERDEERLLRQRQELDERRSRLWDAGQQIAVRMPQMSFSKKGDVLVEGGAVCRKIQREHRRQEEEGVSEYQLFCSV